MGLISRVSSRTYRKPHQVLKIISKMTSTEDSFTKDGAFYNPAMMFNREITIATIETFAKNYYPKKLKILEALGATGLRSVRFAQEIDCNKYIEKIICNDINKHSVETIKSNIMENKVENIVEASCNDAVNLLYENRINYADRKSNLEIHKQKGFDVIDLDPFGGVIPFLDGAVQAVRDNGLLCLTCTDMAVLSGSQLPACWSYYTTWPVRTGQRGTCHEQALRTLVHSVDIAAAKYGRSIQPLLSISIDYYIR